MPKTTPNIGSSIIRELADRGIVNVTHDGVSTDLTLDELSQFFGNRRTAINTYAGAAHVLGAADAWAYVRRTHTANATETLPLESTVAWEPSTVITIHNYGAFNLVLAGAVGVTINYSDVGRLTLAPGGSMQLIRVGVNTWDLI